MAIFAIHSNEGLYLENHPLANARCPLCGEDYKSLSTSHAYCTHCGLKMYVRHDKQLERKCSRCNTLSPKDARYCRLCGKKMELSDGYVFDARVFPPTSAYCKYFTDEKEMGADFSAKNYEFVDLGLSVLWGHAALSTGTTELMSIWMNDNRLKVGDFFSMVSNYERFDEKPNSLFYDRYDVVHKRLGGCCRTPTKKDMEELLRCCAWKPGIRMRDSGELSQYEYGFEVTGPSGESIFMGSPSQWFYYWTSSEADPGYAFALCLGKDPNQKFALDLKGMKEDMIKKKYWEELSKSKLLVSEIRKRPILLPVEQYLNRKDLAELRPSNALWWPVIDK